MLWLPLVGPILQGLFSTATSIFTKFQDTKLGMRVQEVEEEKVSAQIIATTNDDIALRILRDGLCLGPVVWCMLGSWDTIVAIRYPNWMFHIAPFPESMAYLPYAVVVFLLGNIGLNMWKNR